MIQTLNRFGQKREPIFFVIDFDLNRYHVEPLNSLSSDIKFCINQKKFKKLNKQIPYSFKSVSFKEYKSAFLKVQEEIKSGNSYLLNLTFASKLDIKYSLKEIYNYTQARFKLYFKDQFVCFSPERFIKIKKNKIYTYPMKGTIDNSIKDAKEKILSNQKEMAEHTMVVDLLRNDLSLVAKKVRVKKFRYTEVIKAGERELLQVSSKIKGELEDNWQDRLGEILYKLLPAGSISGTPKRKTLEIIKESENYQRGFFSGVFGLFDGKSLDSAVMIRFIEKTKDGLVYKSGGGITIDSDPFSEYEEMREKVYVPFL